MKILHAIVMILCFLSHTICASGNIKIQKLQIKIDKLLTILSNLPQEDKKERTKLLTSYHEYLAELNSLKAVKK